MMKSLSNLAGLWRRKKPLVAQTPSDVVWAENKWRLLRYRPRAAGVSRQTPLLLVPSLINKHYVLDLTPGKSFAEYLVGEGFDVFCIDWGSPTAEDRFTSFDDIVDTALGRALRVTSQTVPHEKAHVLGYCMGGTLAAIHGAVHPERFASFIGLAAPVQFRGDGLLETWTNAPGFDVDALVDGLGVMPAQLLQLSFSMLRPTLSLQKSMNLLDRAWNDEFLDGFLALETWGNDNVSLPGEFYRTYIRQLYQRDALVSGDLTLRGHPVKLEQIPFPTLTVSFEHDNIVSAKSVKAFSEKRSGPHNQYLHMPGGHVGAVVSKHAAKGLWPQLVAFYEQHDAPETPRERATTPRRAPRALQAIGV